MTANSEYRPEDGNQWECQCARCGGEMQFEQCSGCGGDGITAPGELYEQDPLWYDPDDYEYCHQCAGKGGWWFCGNSFDWCNANPMPGRIEIPPHTTEEIK